MEYIVYITKNIVNNKQYIGVHKTECADQFDGYIGCGVNINMPSSYHHPKTPFQLAVKKYGVKNFIRSIIKKFSNYEEAYKLESELVTEEVIKDSMYYNCKLGGRYSELPPLEVYQYQINGTFIKKWNTKTACEFYKISTNSLRTAISTKGLCAGFYWTREYSDIIDISKFGNPNLPKPIYQYNSDGKCIGVFDSIQSSARELNLDISGIYNALNCNKMYKGYYFSNELLEYYKPKSINLKGKAIYMYNHNGEFVKKFSSLTEVGDYFNVKSLTSISNAVKSGKAYKNYKFLLEYTNNIEPFKIRQSTKAVNVYDIYGNLLMKYSGVNEACKALGLNVGSAHRVLKRNARQTKGYILKYGDLKDSL